ncbi:DNA internalization-related competence protein ComEC/Rec2 [Mediannikoviicoccus vaginalis]|uniref:DNA internalization-related competence protein ComEC/Rec2 n=1 Tax=Mediannikoviicoccus vaginalis TaxID=2899727 RepID=UPI001F00BA7F|nr:DNA internalization-related competence protein ComEC/Rec2 [Mediannikoviicoccus vaginalis]
MKKYNSIIILAIVITTMFFGYFFEINKLFYISAFAISLGIFLFSNKNLTYISLGIILGVLCLYRYNILQNNFNYALDNKFFYIDGVVTKAIEKEDSTTLYIKDVLLDGNKKGPNIYVYYKGEESFKIGDRVKFSTKLYIPKNKKIPGRFNFYNYLMAKDLHSYCYANKISKEGVSEKILLKWQGGFDELIKSRASNFHGNLSNFLYSASTGRNIINMEIKDEYRDLGISHILAISGFHIMIIYSSIMFCLRLLSIDMKIRKVISVLFVGFYCHLIDFPFSSFRAFLFLLISVISYLTMIPEDRKKTIAISALIIILVYPFSIFDIGFQFSFLAVTAMEIIYPIIKNKNEKDGSITNLIYLIVSVNTLIFPLQLYYFKSFSYFVFLGNLFVVPILTIVLYLFIPYILLARLPIFGSLLKYIIDFVFKISEYVMKALTPDNGFSKVELSFNMENVVLYFCVIAVIIMIYYDKFQYEKLLKQNAKVILLLSSTTFIFNILLNSTRPIGTLTMIDIEQGDCFLLRYNDENYLIDTGGKIKEGDNSQIVFDNLSYEKVKKLNGISLSHLDKDHIGNIGFIMEKFPKTPVYSHIDSTEYLYNDFIKKDFNSVELKKDDILKKGDLKIEVLNSSNDREENDNSLVLLVDINGAKVLFTGDITSELEESLLDKNIDVDILKIAHHGSKYSYSEEFYKKTSPKIALISVGEYNSYNHPDVNIIKYLNDNKIRTFRTDISGNCYIDFYENYMKSYDSTEYVKEKILSVDKKLSFIYYFLLLYFSRKIFLEEERCLKLEI